MKDTTRKYLIITLLFVAVYGVVMLKHYRDQKQAEGLPNDSVIGKGKPVLLELGSDSCVPCRQMLPILIALHNKQKTFIVSFVDVWKVTEKSAQYHINSIPTQIFFDKDGNELFRHVGFFPKEDILAKWKELGVETQL